MPKRKQTLQAIWEKEPDHISRQIFRELDLYAKDKQFYPVQNALWRYMTEPQYNPRTRKTEVARYPEIGQWKFDYWFGRLVEERFIEIDPTTRAIRCVHLEIVEKEGSDLADL